MSRRDIADELLTLLAAGHETTASTLAWVFERVVRHPDVLAKLEAEAATEANEYRQAVTLEVQRSAPSSTSPVATSTRRPSNWGTG